MGLREADTEEITDWSEAGSVAMPPPVAPEEPVTAEPVAAPKVEATEPVDEALDPEAESEQRDPKTGRFRGESKRARSHGAKPEEVGRIGELTKKYRTEQEEHGKTKAQIAELQRKIDALSAPKAPEVTPFADKEPTLADYEAKGSDDPYTDWLKDWNRWDRKREAHETVKSQRTQFDQQSMEAESQRWEGRMQTHRQRLAEFIKTTPDAPAVFQQVGNLPLNPVMTQAILSMGDDGDPLEGPSTLLHLAKNSDTLTELLLQTANLPVSEHSVALALRRLRSIRGSAGTTGAAAANPVVKPAARTVTPVRTGPIRTSDDEPLDDDADLETFARQNYDAKGRLKGRRR